MVQLLSEEEKERTAYYVAGVCVAMRLLGGEGSVESVTIVPQRTSLWYTRILLQQDSFPELTSQLKVHLAGKATEEIRHGSDSLSSGSSANLKNAAEIVGAILKPGEETPRAYDEAARRTLEDNYREVKRLLKENWAKVKALAEALMQKGELLEREVEEICKNN